MRNTQKAWIYDAWIPAVALVLGAAIRFGLLGRVPLAGDEAYYWLWSRHLDWSYVDNPAGTALLIRLSAFLGGETEAGIRWLNAALGLFVVALAWRLVRELASPRAAAWTAAILAVAPPLVIVSRFVYTDNLMLVLALTHLNVIAPWLCQRRTKLGAMRGLLLGVIGAALLNTKYTAYLYLLGMGLIVLLDAKLRNQPVPWLALGGAGLGTLPLLLWNLNHDWVSVRWQAQHALFGTGIGSSWLGRAIHFGGYLTPPIAAVALIGLLGWAQQRLRPLVGLGLLLTVPVALSPANSPRNADLGVLLLVSAGTVVLTHWVERRATWPQVALVWALILGSALCYALGTVRATMARSRLPASTGAISLRSETQGWREMALDPPEGDTLLLCIDYAIAGQIRYYLGYPAHSTWLQYRIWGIPELPHALILALDYADPLRVTRQIESSFGSVEGPSEVTLMRDSPEPRLFMWRAWDRQVAQETMLDSLDGLSLWDARPASPERESP